MDKAILERIQCYSRGVDGVEEQLHEQQHEAEHNRKSKEIADGVLGDNELPGFAVDDVLVNDGSGVDQLS